jgi:hypothetical protein
MTGQRITKKLRAGIGLLLGGFLVVALNAQDITTTSENPTIVVGTFDSRAVAVAYVQSDAFLNAPPLTRAARRDPPGVIVSPSSSNSDQLSWFRSYAHASPSGSR